MTTGTCTKKFKVKKYSASLPLDPRMRMSSKETQSSVNTGLLLIPLDARLILECNLYIFKCLYF
jgi:hypothetical protein